MEQPHAGFEPEAGAAPDRVVFGLGNPGPRYRRTRHNLGFLLIDRIEEELGIRPRAGEGDYLRSEAVVGGHRLHLVRPLTYMNLSGRAVGHFVARERIAFSRLLVAVDDVALPLGALRLRAKGTAGGHNGLSSVEATLGTSVYARLRLGCGPAPQDADLADFVLGEFAPDEWGVVDELLQRAAQAVRCWVLEGTEVTMSRFNG
jgi:peptidyl-tRNA hydrolase, PTH1 family